MIRTPNTMVTMLPMTRPKLVVNVPGASAEALELALHGVNALFDALGITATEAACAHRKLDNDMIMLTSDEHRAADAWETAQKVVLASCGADQAANQWPLAILTQ